MNVIQKLRSLVTEIRDRKNPIQFVEQWALAARLLERLPVDQAAVKAACRDRNLDALDALVTHLENPSPATQAPATPADVTDADKSAAMRAFRKRLKLSRLSDESRIGNRPTSSGKSSDIDAILPPNDFPTHVWKALAADGRLVYTGQGFYALPENSQEP
ncbi:MAG: hypothetical protein KF757_04855 [Phycisphaeraceae bacterium]|nr:hypothetical protein [Phycisphaeraceae bacterium]MCW5763904.1 hypothetical protein [Phycisphaeraceae bacterium]